MLPCSSPSPWTSEEAIIWCLLQGPGLGGLDECIHSAHSFPQYYFFALVCGGWGAGGWTTTLLKSAPLACFAHANWNRCLQISGAKWPWSSSHDLQQHVQPSPLACCLSSRTFAAIASSALFSTTTAANYVYLRDSSHPEPVNHTQYKYLRAARTPTHPPAQTGKRLQEDKKHSLCSPSTWMDLLLKRIT